LNCCIPAVVKRTDGSFFGTTDEESTTLCPCSSKNFKNFSRISPDCMGDNITHSRCIKSERTRSCISCGPSGSWMQSPTPGRRKRLGHSPDISSMVHPSSRLDGNVGKLTPHCTGCRRRSRVCPLASETPPDARTGT
jgi:hypothetical protein